MKRPHRKARAKHSPKTVEPKIKQTKSGVTDGFGREGGHGKASKRSFVPRQPKTTFLNQDF